MANAERRRVGRSATGLDGAKASDYPKLTLRVPPHTKRQLEALSTLRGQPLWRIIVEMTDTHMAGLPDGERRAVRLFTGYMAESRDER
jgi:hypothetical protein